MTNNYLMIENNIVTNICLWDGNSQTWTPPKEALMLIQSNTPSKDWAWDSNIKDYVLVESLGGGNIGFTWDGSVCTTNEPKPQPPQAAADQPATSGTQTL